MQLAHKIRREIFEKIYKDEEGKKIAELLCGAVANVHDVWWDLDRCIHVFPKTDAKMAIVEHVVEQEDGVIRVGGLIMLSDCEIIVGGETIGIKAYSLVFWRSDVNCQILANAESVVWGVPCGFKLVPHGYKGPPGYDIQVRQAARDIIAACSPCDIQFGNWSAEKKYILCPWVEVAYMNYIEHRGRFKPGYMLTEDNEREMCLASDFRTPMLRPNYKAMDSVGGGISNQCAANLESQVVASYLGGRWIDADGDKTEELNLNLQDIGGEEGGLVDMPPGKKLSLFLHTPRVWYKVYINK